MFDIIILIHEIDSIYRYINKFNNNIIIKNININNNMQFITIVSIIAILVLQFANAFVPSARSLIRVTTGITM